MHTHDDADWDEVKTWFYAALSGTAQRPDDVNARNFEKFLDSPHRVIIETEANLVVSFDVAKFNEFTARAIAAGLGVDVTPHDGRAMSEQTEGRSLRSSHGWFAGWAIARPLG